MGTNEGKCAVSDRWTFDRASAEWEAVLDGWSSLRSELCRLRNPNSYRDGLILTEFHAEIDSLMREDLEGLYARSGWSEREIDDEVSRRYADRR